MEVAVKQIVSGKAVQKASSIRNPESLDHFVQYRLPGIGQRTQRYVSNDTNIT